MGIRKILIENVRNVILLRGNVIKNVLRIPEKMMNSISVNLILLL